MWIQTLLNYELFKKSVTFPRFQILYVKAYNIMQVKICPICLLYQLQIVLPHFCTPASADRGLGWSRSWIELIWN